MATNVANEVAGAAAESPQALLLGLLAIALGGALGGEGRAQDTLARALAKSGRAALPDAPGELLSFVKAHLLGDLMADVGPRVAMVLVDDLVLDFPATTSVRHVTGPEKMTSAGAAPPISTTRVRPNVALIDDDRFLRASLARRPIRGGCDVRIVEREADLASEKGLHFAVVDVDAPGVERFIRALSELRIPIVARTKSVGPASALLTKAGVVTFEVRSKDEPFEELLERLNRAR